jgi:hypothetical protein
MATESHSDKTSTAALKPALESLKKLNRHWRKTGSKCALGKYLRAVLALYAASKKTRHGPTMASQIARLVGSGLHPKRHLIRTIIDATSTADRKSKSRWTQALRFAWRERSNWKDLTDCLRANGGIAGCADKWADLQAETRTPQGCVRVGGEDRVPKIPLFVGVGMAHVYSWP